MNVLIKAPYMIFFRILFFSYGICCLISFAAILFKGTSFATALLPFILMALFFWGTFAISENWFYHEPIGNIRKLFQRLCFFVISIIFFVAFIANISLKQVTLGLLYNVASLVEASLFFLGIAVSGKFPAYYVSSLWGKR